ncbi:MAG: hypothetical protein ACRC28_14575 [Clostridium sp.]|uniref:hypothetical protein n=1 Tax=Clostridium sp. TaxID=1506 RepID=UPI003F385A3D
MNRINIERLKYLSTNMQEIIQDLDEITRIYDEQLDIIKKHLEQSFRTSFLQYKEVLGNYMSQCLKVLAISVSKMTYGESLEVCIKEGYLPNENILLYKTLSKFRNDTAHVYKKPPFLVLLNFYKENREFLMKINEKMNETIKQNLNQKKDS